MVGATLYRLPRSITQRMRFKLSSIILATMVAAVICMEGRWQLEQNRLERMATKVGARVEFLPRSTAGYIWSWLVLSPRPSFIAGLQIDAYLVDSPIFTSHVVSQADLRQLLALPASRELTRVRLCGTAVDDRMLQCLSDMKNLNEASINFSGASRAAADQLIRDLPRCNIAYGSSNGKDFLRLAHSELFALTDSIEDFALASEGNAEAVSRLLQLDCQGNENDRQTIVHYLQSAKSSACMDILHSGLHSSLPDVRANAIAALASRGILHPLPQGLDDSDIGVRLTSVHCIGQQAQGLWAARILQAALQDPEFSVRDLAIATLAKIDNERAVSILIAATRDPDLRVRKSAFEALGAARTESARLALMDGLSDLNPTVRALAAWALRNHPNPLTIDALASASKDEASIVRANALSALAIASGLLQAQQDKIAEDPG